MTKPDRKLLTQAAYARHRGCSRPAVARAIREQRITLAPGGLIDPVVADAEWRANTRPTVRSNESAQALHHAEQVAGVDLVGDLRHWRTRTARADALTAEMGLAERQSKFIEVEPLIDVLTRMNTVLRTLLLQVPSRMAQEWPGTHAERVALFEMASRLQREALEVISDGPLQALEAQAAALQAAGEDEAI